MQPQNPTNPFNTGSDGQAPPTPPNPASAPVQDPAPPPNPEIAHTSPSANPVVAPFNPAPPAGPAPFTPPSAPATPPAGMSGQPQHIVGGVPGGMPVHPTGDSSKKWIKIGVIVAAVLALGVGIYFAVMMFINDVKLEEYSNDDYSIQKPVGYELEEKSNITYFNEKGDASTASAVMVLFQDFPRTLTAAEQDTVLKAFKDTVEDSIDEITEDGTLENVVVKDVTYKGGKGVEVTAEATKDGKRGYFKMVSGINGEAFYGAAVKIHPSDPGLNSKADQIIQSLTLK